MSLDLADDQVLTVLQASELLGMKPATVRKWVREGRIPARKLGERKWVMYRSDLEQLLGRDSDDAPVEPLRHWGEVQAVKAAQLLARPQ